MFLEYGHCVRATIAVCLISAYFTAHAHTDLCVPYIHRISGPLSFVFPVTAAHAH